MPLFGGQPDPRLATGEGPEVPIEDFLAVKRAWEFKRRMEGKKTGRKAVA